MEIFVYESRFKDLTELERGSVIGCYRCEPYITEHSAKRLIERGKARRHWTLEQWTRVLWTDESRFSIWRSDGGAWVW